MNKSEREKISDSNWLALTKKAQQAYKKAYAPYSNFHVGAAALTSENTIVQGCNVENASYGLTVCAERNCIAQGVINNESSSTVSYKAIVIYTEQEKLTPPCGACRQVISEFFPADAQVMATNHVNSRKIWSIQELLPDAFLSSDLIEQG